MATRRLGSGVPVSGGAFEGVVARADSVADVMALLGTELEETVLLTDQAAATSLAPILPRVRGVLCTGGGPATHLAIVARGLGLSCVMQVELDVEMHGGERVAVDEAGTVTRA